MPNKNRLRRLGRSIKYDQIALSYFLRAGITNNTEKYWVNYLVKQMRSVPAIFNAYSNGLLNICSPTGIGAAVHNLMNSSFTMTSTTMPGHTAANGFSFDGIAQFLNTNLTPSTSVTDNSHTVVLYNKTNIQSAGRDWGAIQSVTARINGVTRSTVDAMLMTCYDGTNILQPANTNGAGYTTWAIISTSSRYILKDGSVVIADTTTNAGAAGDRPNQPVMIGAQNNAGTAASFRQSTIPTFGIGTLGLSSTDSIIMEGFLRTYNQNVISGGR